LAHIIIFLYDSDGNQIGEYHPPDDPETGGASTKFILTLDDAAFAAALDAAIAQHPSKAADGITLTFKAKA